MTTKINSLISQFCQNSLVNFYPSLLFKNEQLSSQTVSPIQCIFSFRKAVKNVSTLELSVVDKRTAGLWHFMECPTYNFLTNL